MRAGPGRPVSRIIPWYRRLEARVLLGVTVIAGLSLVSVALVTGRVVRSHTFARARSDVTAAGAAFTTLITSRADSLDAQSRLITTLPVFRAHMQSTELASDRDTLEAMATEYCRDLSAAFCVVMSPEGKWLAGAGLQPSPPANRLLAPIVGPALRGQPFRRIVTFNGSVYLVVSQPARFGDEVLGSFVAGYRLDDDLARNLSNITRNQIALIGGRTISGTSLSGTQRASLEHALRSGAPDEGDVVMWQLAAGSYVGGSFALRLQQGDAADARLLLLEDWAPTERFIDDTVRQLSMAGAVVFAFAVVLSVLLSRRMSRPLRDIADRAGDIAAGEWDSRLAVRGSAEAVAMAEAFNDMTESLSHWHAQAQERTQQLQAAYERYAAVTNSAPDSIVSADADGAIVFWNTSAARTFGCAEADVLGRTLYSLFDDPEGRIGAGISAALAAVDAAARTFAADARRSDGTSFPCELTVAAWKSEGTSWLTAIIRDVTERRRAEEMLHLRDAQLRQAQKMEAIGRLASGVAHDFNNALSVIQGYTEDVMQCLGDANEHVQDLREVLKASQSAASLTRQLLAFSRKQVIAPQVLSLSDVIDNVQRMLRRLVGEEIDLRMTLAADGDLVFADRGQIEQVIVNLCVNARDAMAEGGRMDVAVSQTWLIDDLVCERLGVARGAFVTLTVADTGHGMDAATAAQIFEPFFTTKGEGKGTGLGLATVYGIVRQSGGAIDLETRPGSGTTFRVHLPVARDGEAVADAAGDEPIAAGGGTVLLVEDEEPVRTILRRSLHAAGYAVLEASSGVEAIALSRAHPDEIHVLLTDVVMPGIDGVALSQTIAAERPRTRVLYMSGHAADSFSPHGFDLSSVRLIQKPFSAVTLCRELRDVLAA